MDGTEAVLCYFSFVKVASPPCANIEFWEITLLGDSNCNHHKAISPLYILYLVIFNKYGRIFVSFNC